MKYFVVITLVICVIGVSSVFAIGQTKTATSNLAVMGQTARTMAKSTVKYLMPIESMLVGISLLLSSLLSSAIPLFIIGFPALMALLVQWVLFPYLFLSM